MDQLQATVRTMQQIKALQLEPQTQLVLTELIAVHPATPSFSNLASSLDMSTCDVISSVCQLANKGIITPQSSPNNTQAYTTDLSKLIRIEISERISSKQPKEISVGAALKKFYAACAKANKTVSKTSSDFALMRRVVKSVVNVEAAIFTYLADGRSTGRVKAFESFTRTYANILNKSINSKP